MTAATDLIADERERQHSLGFDSTHDAEHDEGDLAFAGICYAAPMPVHLLRIEEEPASKNRAGGTLRWVEPWPVNWNRKPRAVTRDERIAELVRGGALIAAELDRLLGEEAT